MVKNQIDKNGYTFPLIVVASALLFAILAGATLGRYSYRNLVDTNKERKEQAEVLEKLQKKLATLKELDSKKEEIFTRAKRVLSALPQDSDVAGLFLQTDKLISESGFKTSGVGGGAAATSEVTTAAVGLTENTYSTDLSEGNYQSIKGFYEKMHNSLRLVSIDSFVITESDQKLNVNISFKAYSRGGNEN